MTQECIDVVDGDLVLFTNLHDLRAHIRYHWVLWILDFDVNVNETYKNHRNFKEDSTHLNIDIIFDSQDGELLDNSSEVSNAGKNDDDIKEAQNLVEEEHLLDAYWAEFLKLLLISVDEDMWLVDELLGENLVHHIDGVTDGLVDK